MSLSIHFLGGAGTVTGSKYLIDNGHHQVMVDCGLFEGLKDLRLRNWAPFPIQPNQIDAVVLTHAHLDHTGYLPLLVKNGFNKTVYCTPPTRDLSKIILLDSAKIQEEDAEYANKIGFSKHNPAQPLYTIEDTKKAMQLFRCLKEDLWTEFLPGWQLRFKSNGHILGSSFVEIQVEGKKLVFSGDVGRPESIVMRSPCTIEEADYLFLESTYGDRLHAPSSALDVLAKITNETITKKGHLLIPSFAIGRTQDLLFLFATLKKQKKVPDIPIFLDSPLGINATELFIEYPTWHALNKQEVQSLCQVATLVKSQQQSKELLNKKKSTVVIAGSGMVSGGRILHHLSHRASDPRNTVLLVGFQASGTRGRMLQEGGHELKIHGQYVPVRCQVETISNLSAHSDQNEILVWLKKFKKAPQTVFITHGEPQASDALRIKIKDKLNWKCHIPKYLEKIEL